MHVSVGVGFTLWTKYILLECVFVTSQICCDWLAIIKSWCFIYVYHLTTFSVCCSVCCVKWPLCIFWLLCTQNTHFWSSACYLLMFLFISFLVVFMTHMCYHELIGLDLYNNPDTACLFSSCAPPYILPLLLHYVGYKGGGCDCLWEGCLLSLRFIWQTWFQRDCEERGLCWFYSNTCLVNSNWGVFWALSFVQKVSVGWIGNLPWFTCFHSTIVLSSQFWPTKLTCLLIAWVLLASYSNTYLGCWVAGM